MIDDSMDDEVPRARGWSMYDEREVGRAGQVAAAFPSTLDKLAHGHRCYETGALPHQVAARRARLR